MVAAPLNLAAAAFFCSLRGSLFRFFFFSGGGDAESAREATDDDLVRSRDFFLAAFFFSASLSPLSLSDALDALLDARDDTDERPFCCARERLLVSLLGDDFLRSGFFVSSSSLPVLDVEAVDLRRACN